jgi:hypothetical protein
LTVGNGLPWSSSRPSEARAGTAKKGRFDL